MRWPGRIPETIRRGMLSSVVVESERSREGSRQGSWSPKWGTSSTLVSRGNAMSRAQTGFTLVEIAIVLVIIGLLLGGILKGQGMITQAKIKNVVSDFSGISAAYYGYQDRYRAIPGDDPNAATRWTTPTTATAGNGNGVVAGTHKKRGSPFRGTLQT